MPPILNLKFKGNKSFVAFSNLGDTESLTNIWKVCSKVASYLEQGQRLENLSWRLWHLQNLMVDTDNAKSKREFKKLSKCMGDKLDKEKGRSIEELEAPDFKHNAAADMFRQRAVEKERNREASQSTKPGMIRRMQFTFSVDQPQPPTNNHTAPPPVKKPDLKPSPEFKDSGARRSGKQSSRAAFGLIQRKPMPLSQNISMIDVEAELNDALQQKSTHDSTSVHFPSYFPNGFEASATFYEEPLTHFGINYGEGVGLQITNDDFIVPRPTIELPFDDILNNSDSADSSATSDGGSSPSSSSGDFLVSGIANNQQSAHGLDTTMQGINEVANASTPRANDPYDHSESSDDDVDLMSTMNLKSVSPISHAVKQAPTPSTSPSKTGSAGGLRSGTRSSGRPALTVKTQPLLSRASGPGATATNVNGAAPRSGAHTGNSAPGGVKAECSNCGATHTPLWRRGLNDELNCNACGLYCKLHKRPRPKSMRNAHGEGRTQMAPRQETVDVMAQCYNCHTTATPLWRKDDEGKTVCNACGLYYKLHGSPRPISMKSDVIRKRSRHDARRAGPAVEETSSGSPGASRRASPVAEPSPTLAPDSTTRMTFDYHSDSEFRVPQSELSGALGQDQEYSHNGFDNMFSLNFPGPYHPDFLQQYQHQNLNDPLPFAHVDSSEMETTTTPSRSSKRRRMSTDSVSEPPSSAVSYTSYNDSISSVSSASSLSHRSSMEFSFNYPSFNLLRGPGQPYWHPPMLPVEKSPHYIHPPMLLPSEESPMDYLQPPMLPQEEESLFSTYLHPPMVLAEEQQHPSAPMNIHPPMFPNDSFFSAGRSETYDAMHSF